MALTSERVLVMLSIRREHDGAWTGFQTERCQRRIERRGLASSCGKFEWRGVAHTFAAASRCGLPAPWLPTFFVAITRQQRCMRSEHMPLIRI